MNQQYPPPPPHQKHAELHNAHALQITSEERNMGMLAHLLTFCGYAFPLGNIIAPLIIYLIKKDESSYVAHHASEALNFQISMLIYCIASVILCFIIIGFPILIALIIFDLVCTIIAAVKANEGAPYRYPLSIRFIS